MMQSATVLNLMALATLVPAAFLGVRREPKRDSLMWLTLVAAMFGASLWVVAAFSPGWRTDFGAALWVTVAVTVGLFIVLVVFEAEAWRLGALLSPAVLVLGVLATIWTSHEGAKPLVQPPGGLVALHIAVSVATYGLVTIAAIAALAAILQERALKSKRRTAVTRMLPAVAVCDRMMVRLLIGGEVVLGAGLLSGMALRFAEVGTLAALDHKTILTVTAFVLIAGLLGVHFRSGLRGRRAARWALAAYLLLTLGYPGVKFVTDVLMG
jgi:ABC-type uncharacterized transport system permease subunit